MAAKPKTLYIFGALAIAIAAVAAYLLYDYLKGEEKRVSEAVAIERVVVAATEIPVGSAINITQIKTVDWPKANVPQGALLSTDQATSRVAVQTFMPGDPIVEGKLVPKEGAPGSILTYKIPEGHRAMTVSVDQVAGVAGFINPGNIVDVVLTASPPGSSQSISKIVLQNVPVLAVGQIVDQKEGKPVAVPTVTMDVSPEDAEKLAVASTQGRLQLVLRRAGDKEVANTGGATVSKVMSGAKGGAPVKVTSSTSKKAPVAKVQEAPKEEAKVSVEVYRGGQKTTETFKGQ
jgi:pilus assembly protein CpaB